MSNLLLIVVLTAGAYYDIRTREVPNKLIFSGLAASLILTLVNRGYTNILAALIVFIILSIIYHLNENILPGGDIKGIVFIVMTKGISFFAVAAYYMMLTAIPILVYIIIRSRINKKPDVPPLYVPMLLGCILAIGGNL